MKKIILGMTLLISMSTFAAGIEFSNISCEGLANGDLGNEKVVLQVFTSFENKNGGVSTILLSRLETHDGIQLGRNSSVLISNVEISNINEADISLKSERFMTSLKAVKSPVDGVIYVDGKVGTLKFNQMECKFLNH